MAANNCYRVTFHYEKSGKRVSETAQANVIAADSTFNSINTVLNNNNQNNNGVGTLMIESIGHVGAAGGFLS